MLLSDVSVKRPVFAAVISLVLVIIGTISATRMTIREYPEIQRPVVSIDVNYRGASAEVVEQRVTQVIENTIAGISGITKIDSSSADGESEVSIEFSEDRDIDNAANDVRERVSRVLNNLPEEADPPEINKDRSGSGATMWIRVSSDSRSLMEVSDFAERYLVDAFSTVDGVARVRGSGRRKPAMRIWIDSTQLAARGLTVSDIEDVSALALGSSRGAAKTYSSRPGDSSPTRASSRCAPTPACAPCPTSATCRCARPTKAT